MHKLVNIYGIAINNQDVDICQMPGEVDLTYPQVPKMPIAASTMLTACENIALLLTHAKIKEYRVVFGRTTCAVCTGFNDPGK